MKADGFSPATIRISEMFQDDVMHVILRIRVPLLRVRSQYSLIGKAGKEVLRGNGLLAGNFSKRKITYR